MTRCDFCLCWQPIFDALGNQCGFKCTASKEERVEQCVNAIKILGTCLSGNKVQMEQDKTK